MSFKQAPLEIFLTGITPSSQTSSSSQGENPALSAGLLLVLTILGQTRGTMSDSLLAERSELPPELYRKAIHLLQEQELIQSDPTGYELTKTGQAAAERARFRLLSP